MPPEDWASSVVVHARSQLPTLGSGRLICIDGLTGAGKTTLAAAVAGQCGAPVVHTDELLEGWGGLPGLGATLDQLLRPLAAGRPGCYRCWDWYADGWAESRDLAPAPVLVVEGVGAGASAYDDLITTLVWVEAERDERLERAVARDGEALRPHLVRWLDDEAALHRRERTRERADLVFVS